MPCHVPFPSRNKASKHPTWIRFPDLDLLLSRISLPLFFTHCRSSSKFSSIPLYRVTRPTYRVTKTYIVGKRLDFSQPPSTDTDWNTRKRPLGFYTRVRYVRARIQGVPFSTFSKMVARRRRMIFKSVGISIRKLMIIKEEWLIFDVISNEFLLSIQVIGEFLRSRALSFVMVMPLPRYIFGDGSFFQRKIKKKKIPLIYLLILSRLFFFLRIVID